jgi:hypothetical protein
MLIHFGRIAVAVTGLGLALMGLTAGQASAAFTAEIRGTTLHATGDGASDSLVVQLAQDNAGLLQLVVNNEAPPELTFDRTRFDAVVVDAGGGADRIEVLLGGGLFLDEALTLRGGAGDDVLLGNVNDEVLVGGSGDDTVDGGIGDDTVSLGSGDDTFAWDFVDGDDTVEGDSGRDALVFSGSGAPELIGITANGSRAHFTRRIATLNFGFTVDVESIETASVRAAGGMDTVTVGDLGATALGLVDVDLASIAGQGDAAADTVVVEGTALRDKINVSRDGTQVLVGGLATRTRITDSEPALDTLQVNALAGDDDVSVAPDVVDVIRTLVDLGAE